MKIRSKRLTRLAAGALAAIGLTQAAPAVEMEGYFRAGPGSTHKGAARQCYGLDGPGLRYRLGNECDIYAEIAFVQTMKLEGVEAKLNFMPVLWNGATDTGSQRLDIAQLFASVKGVDFMPEASFWAGKRFYVGNQGVHIVDTWFWKPGAGSVGAGVDDINAGPGKLALAYFRTDGPAADGSQPASRLHVDFSQLKVNEDGRLRLNLSLTRGDFEGGTTGAAVSVHHTQDKFLGMGGANEVMLQFAQGSANINGAFGGGSDPSSVKSWRIIDSPTWQVGNFGGQALLMFGENKGPAGKTQVTSLGGRASYAFTRNLKMLTELGISGKKPDASAQQRVTKLTVGPAIAMSPDFWSRPELRLYVTTAKWNAAAGADAANGLAIGKTSGTSAGAQVEVWF